MFLFVKQTTLVEFYFVLSHITFKSIERCSLFHGTFFFITFNILQTYVHIHIPVFINFSTLLVVVCNASKIYFYLLIYFVYITHYLSVNKKKKKTM